MEDLLYKPGERIGNYEVIELIAGGGFSAIYKARDLKDAPKAAPSAVKLSRFDFRTVPRAMRVELNARMWREQDALALLDHQNIVRTYEWGLHDGKVWYAMELLKGPTLGSYLAEEPRTWLELMLTYRQLLEAVAHCHENGVVHRDLKPSNILVTPQLGPVVSKDEEDHSGQDRRTPTERLKTRLAVLLDFGLGHLVGVPPLTAPGALIGTAEYLPPWYVRELLSAANGNLPSTAYKAEPVDDVYQLGLLLYVMLTGRLPTRTPNGQLMPLLEEIRDVPPAHPRELNPDAPEALSELALRCLGKRSRKVPPDAMALRSAWLEAMHEDGETLRRKAPLLEAGPETTLGQPLRARVREPEPDAARAPELSPPSAELSPPSAEPAPPPGPADTVSAPADVLAEANALMRGQHNDGGGGGPGPSTWLGVAPHGQTTSAPAESPARPKARRRELAVRLLRRNNLKLRRVLTTALAVTALACLGFAGLGLRLHLAT